MVSAMGDQDTADNVDPFLQTTVFLLSACSVDGSGAGCQCYSGRVLGP